MIEALPAPGASRREPRRPATGFAMVVRSVVVMAMIMAVSALATAPPAAAQQTAVPASSADSVARLEPSPLGSPRPPSAIDDMVARNSVRCGINTYAGYGHQQADGRWHGFMVDMCRAIAAAVLGDATLVDIVPIEAQTRFDALRKGQIDVLTDGTTVTLERDTFEGFDFPRVFLYDGQGFMAHADAGIADLKQAGDARICVIAGTTTLANLEEYLHRTKLPLQPIVLQSDEGAWTAFARRRCDLITNDRIGLLVRAARLTPDGSRDFMPLPEVISKEPLSPAIRGGDPRLFTLVDWLIAGLLTAEEEGITAGTIDTFADTERTDALVILGRTDDRAASLGVAPGWLARAVRQVGNYGEIYERNFGAGSPFRIPRGLNALWNQGGLMYSPPLR